jgi:hypothetical protein
MTEIKENSSDAARKFNGNFYLKNNFEQQSFDL